MASTLKPVSLRISSDDDEPRDGSHLGSRSKIPSGMMSPGMAIFNRVMTPTNSSASLPSPRSTPRSPRTPKMIIEVLRSKKASAKKPSVEHLQIPTGKCGQLFLLKSIYSMSIYHVYFASAPTPFISVDHFFFPL